MTKSSSASSDPRRRAVTGLMASLAALLIGSVLLAAGTLALNLMVAKHTGEAVDEAPVPPPGPTRYTETPQR